MSPRSSREAGVVLALLTGLLLLLLAGSMLFLLVSRAAARSSAALARLALAALTADSGMEYAASRLRPDYPPRLGSIESRGDDWTFREGAAAALAAAANPSFSHGEGWSDVASGLARAGAYDAGIDDVSGSPDRDGDGRFSAWSGRLRGHGGPYGRLFSLRIQGCGGRIPLNAGKTDGPEAARISDAGPEAYHAGIAHALDNLGARLLPDDGTRPWRKDVPTAGTERILFSCLGRDLIRCRPVGGYRSWSEAERRLAPLGYDPKDLDRVAPYVDLGPYAQRMDERLHRGWTDFQARATYVPIELCCAPEEVLDALWMHLTVPFGYPPRYAATAAAWDNACTHTGAGNLAFKDLLYKTSQFLPYAWSMKLFLFPDESRALASWAAAWAADAFRPGRGGSWERFRSDLIDNANGNLRLRTIFARDYEDLTSRATVSPDPLAALSWIWAKGELAVGAVSIDLPMENTAPCAAARTGRDLFPHPGHGRIPYPSGLYWDYLGRMNIRSAYADPAKSPYQWGTFDYNSSGGSSPRHIQPLVPQGLTMAPPAAYEVECLGRLGGDRPLTARRSGRLLAAEVLCFTSQDDFERCQASPDLSARGIAVVDDPFPSRRRSDVEDAASGRTYRHLATLPGFNGRDSSPSGDATWAPSPRCWGGISLATRQAGRQGAVEYWPFAEDLDGDAGNGFLSEPGALRLIPSWSSPPFGSHLFPVGANGAAPPGGGIALLPFSRPSPAWVDEFSVEGWLTPASSNYYANDAFLRFGAADRPSDTILIQATRRLKSTLTSTETWTYVTLTIQWLMTDDDPATPDATGSATFGGFWLADETSEPPASGQTASGQIHAVLTSDLAEDGGILKNRFHLYLNGRDVTTGDWFLPKGNYALGWRSFRLATSPRCTAASNRASEVRVYDRALTAAEAMDRFRRGRFAVPRLGRTLSPAELLPPNDVTPNPAYRSPRYELGPGSALLAAQWSRSSTGDLETRVGMRSLIIGFDDAGGARVLDAPDPETVHALSALGPCRAFQYAVELYAPGVPPSALYDTPVLESIWLVVARPGFSRVWDGWAAEERR